MTKLSYEGGLLFTQAHKFVRSRIYLALEPYNLNPSYWSVLSAVVYAEDGVRLANVARQMDVKAPLVTMLSNDLIERGLIKRLPHHTDRRAKLLIPTPEGKKLAAEIEKKLSTEVSSLMNGLTDSEVMVFEKVLISIIKNAQPNSI